MTPPPPQPSLSPPLSKGQKLVAGLYVDWEEMPQHEGDDEHIIGMVPKCPSMAPMKHMAKIKASSPADKPEMNSLSPARDLNSNSWSHDQMLLSLYRQDGGNTTGPHLPPPSNHSPPTMQGRKATVSSTRGSGAGDTGQSSMLDTVANKDRDGFRVDKENKADHIEHFLGMILIDRSPINVELALVRCNTPVISPQKVKDLLSRSKDQVDRLVRNNEDRMGKLMDIGKHGLVHWSGEGNLKWTCLGEKEEQTERGWKVEGGGRRTRSRGAEARGRSWEWESDWVETEDGGVDGSEGDREDDIYDYDEVGDDGVEKQIVNPSKKFKLIDSDDEDDGGKWLKKPSKGKGRGKGRGRGRKLGGRTGKSSILLPTSKIGVGNYFPTVDKNSQEEVPGPAYQDIPTAEANKQDEKDSASTEVSPTTAICNRVLLGPEGNTYTRTRTERRGACPMCNKEFGMTMLETHAAKCQGERK